MHRRGICATLLTDAPRHATCSARRWRYGHSSAHHLLGDSLTVHRQLEVWLQQLGCNALLPHAPRMLQWILSTPILLGSLLAHMLRIARLLQTA